MMTSRAWPDPYPIGRGIAVLTSETDVRVGAVEIVSCYVDCLPNGIPDREAA